MEYGLIGKTLGHSFSKPIPAEPDSARRAAAPFTNASSAWASTSAAFSTMWE